MSLVSAGNGLCICLIMYLFILRMKLVLILVFVQVLELAACAISSPFRTYHDFYDWEMWRLRGSQSFSWVAWLLNNALLSIFSSRRHTAMQITVPRRRQVDVTHKWPDWISDPLGMGPRLVQLKRCGQIAPSTPMKGSCESWKWLG